MDEATFQSCLLDNQRELAQYQPLFTKAQFLVPFIYHKGIRSRAVKLFPLLSNIFSERKHYFRGRSWQDTLYIGNVLDSASLSWTRSPQLQGNTLQQLHRLLGNATRPCYVDVGANGGLYCSNIGRLLAGRGQVIGFEANPELAKLAAATAALNRLENVGIFAIAASESEGTLKFNIVPDRSTSSSVLYDHLLRECGGNRDKIKQIEVPCIKLDERLPNLPAIRQADKIVFKVDVEGHELSVFKGSAEFIRSRCPTIFFEWNSNCATPGGETLDTMVGFLSSLCKYKFSAFRDAGDDVGFPPPRNAPPLNIIAEPGS